MTQIVNCTFFNNEHFGINLQEGGLILNCIIANCGRGAMGLSFPLGVTVMNNCFWGNGDGIAHDASDLATFEAEYGAINNIEANPVFVNTLVDDYHLCETSPCRNTGFSSHSLPIPDFDFDGFPRPGSDPIDSARWDIGAFEYKYGPYIFENEVKMNDFVISVFPSPFNSSCRISASANAQISIYNIDGKLIANLREGERVWSPDKNISSGVFLVRVMKDGQSSSKRIVYMK
jgi:hypothetical protein